MNIPFSSAGGVEKILSLALPQDSPKAVIQLTHGMAEHYSRYRELAEFLAARGFVLAGYDLLGHGADTPKDKLGWFGQNDGWQKLVDDMHMVHAILTNRFPDTRHMMLGHSMGSFLTREYVIEHGNEQLDGIILSGTAWMPPALLNLVYPVTALICSTGGGRKPSQLLNKLIFDKNNKAFAPSRTMYDWISSDEDQVDLYVEDPLCGFVFTGCGFKDLIFGLKQLAKVERLDRIPKDLPVLFISGKEDPVGGKQAEGPKKVADQYKNAGITDITLQLYDNGRHEMFNEVNREEVMQNLLAWLER